MSLFNQLHTLYGELPEWMINCAGSLYYAIPHSVRYGQVYSKTEAFLEKMKYATKEEIEAYQNEQFLNIVNQAYNHVPYYRKRWDEYGVNVSQIRDLRDIVMLPTMDKADLREAGTDLISDKYQQSDLMYITTSGSTGNPVGFYQKKICS